MSGPKILQQSPHCSQGPSSVAQLSMNSHHPFTGQRDNRLQKTGSKERGVTRSGSHRSNKNH
jgi:hypothetical protein